MLSSGVWGLASWDGSRYAVAMAVRPRKRAKGSGGSTTKDVSLRMLLTREEKAALTKAARGAGLNVSTWLRQLGLREAGYLKR